MPQNLVVILGPTATGKTKLAAELASIYNGEIISADSRQVYRGMDIGTGKDLADYFVNNTTIPYHLIDIINPQEEYNLFQFKKDFYSAFETVTQKSKLPILAGGTGLYLSAVIQNYDLHKADFEKDARTLQEMDIEKLRELLLALNQPLHNTTDLTSKERLIKAIQIAKSKACTHDTPKIISPLVVGVNPGREIVKQRITERLKKRLKNGMIEEVETLLRNNVTFEKLMFFGLEYKFIALYLKGEINYNDMFQKLNSAIHGFAKRQMTWFRKMEKEGVIIHWIDGPDIATAGALVKKEMYKIEK